MHLVRHGAALVAEAPVQQGPGDPTGAFGLGFDGGAVLLLHEQREPAEHGGQQGFLGGEVIEQPALGHARVAGRGFQRQAGDAARLHDGLGGIEDPGSGVGTLGVGHAP